MPVLIELFTIVSYMNPLSWMPIPIELLSIASPIVSFVFDLSHVDTTRYPTMTHIFVKTEQNT